MRKLNSNPNVINSDANYPNGRIRNNTSSGNGTPVNEAVYGDIHVNKDKLMDLYGITPNNLPDNEANGYQIIEAYRALASKNDFVLPLTLNTGVLSVPIKIGYMLENEQVICKAGFNLASETEIKGSDNETLPFTALGLFKTNEYVRLIKNASSITLVRLVDNVSIDDIVALFNYLKKASQSEENAGAIDTKATTPLTNLTAFIRRVIGADSGSYLATLLRNGLMSKEDFAQVQTLYKIKNIGFFSGLDVGGSSGSLSVGGDIATATATIITSDGSKVLVTMANAMANTNYMVESYVQSEGSNVMDTAEIGSVVFKVISTTQFEIGIIQFTPRTQNIKLHLKVVQL